MLKYSIHKAGCEYKDNGISRYTSRGYVVIEWDEDHSEFLCPNTRSYGRGKTVEDAIKNAASAGTRLLGFRTKREAVAHIAACLEYNTWRANVANFYRSR